MEEIRTHNVLLRSVHTEDIYTQGDERCILSSKITQDFPKSIQLLNITIALSSVLVSLINIRYVGTIATAAHTWNKDPTTHK